ncbi:MAG TPA: hypothetical protein VNO32_42060 [Candidatus Acidoferrum sp.]|jgi:hypothetical protein|nr:hypothetical protein [Candidatus Acidoferrum sp.]
MIPDEAKSPDPEPAAKSEEAQPKDSPKEDPDKIRGEVFKRTFPDVSRKPPE